jgi:16S rRNA (cytosine967-C5)-methyltransferase
VLRYLPQLEYVCQQLMSKPLTKQQRPLQFLLYVGIYQLKFMRIPDHAAISETVEAARLLKGNAFTGLINGVLRNIQRRPELFDFSQSSVSVQHNHPSWFVQSLQNAYPDVWPEILSANQQKAPLWLRVNLQRCSVAAYTQALDDAHIAWSQPIDWMPTAIQLAKSHDVTLLPGYAEGWFAVQDIAAQHAAFYLDPKPNERILDACCAPGGKTGHILELSPTAHVVAIDQDDKRLARVHENLARLGHHAEVRAADAREPTTWWDHQQFDRILLDVPCSATGVIRRHPDIRWLRKKADIAALVHIQQQLLQQLWPLLKPGGVLLYATCSVLPEENTQQIADFLAGTADAKVLPLHAEVAATEQQWLPGTIAGDGFFYAKLAKTGTL